MNSNNLNNLLYSQRIYKNPNVSNINHCNDQLPIHLNKSISVPTHIQHLTSHQYRQCLNVDPQHQNSKFFQNKNTDVYNKINCSNFSDIHTNIPQINLINRIQLSRQGINSSPFMNSSGQIINQSLSNHIDNNFCLTNSKSSISSSYSIRLPNPSTYTNQVFPSCTYNGTEFRLQNLNITPGLHFSNASTSYLSNSIAYIPGKKLEHQPLSLTSFSNNNSRHIFVPLMTMDSKLNNLTQLTRVSLQNDRSVIHAVPISNASAVSYLEGKMKSGQTFIPSLTYNASFVTNTKISPLPNSTHSSFYSRALTLDPLNQFPSLFKNYLSPSSSISSNISSVNINMIPNTIYNCVPSESLKVSCSDKINEKTLEYSSCLPIDVPFQWKRSIENGNIIYYSPSGVMLESIETIKQYLLSEGTCKCGLVCPIKIKEIFNFDIQRPSNHLNIEDKMKEENNTKFSSSCSTSHCEYWNNAITNTNHMRPNTIEYSKNYTSTDGYDSESTKSALSGEEDDYNETFNTNEIKKETPSNFLDKLFDKKRESLESPYITQTCTDRILSCNNSMYQHSSLGNISRVFCASTNLLQLSSQAMISQQRPAFMNPSFYTAQKSFADLNPPNFNFLQKTDDYKKNLSDVSFSPLSMPISNISDNSISCVSDNLNKYIFSTSMNENRLTESFESKSEARIVDEEMFSDNEDYVSDLLRVEHLQDSADEIDGEFDSFSLPTNEYIFKVSESQKSTSDTILSTKDECRLNILYSKYNDIEESIIKPFEETKSCINNNSNGIILNNSIIDINLTPKKCLSDKFLNDENLLKQNSQDKIDSIQIDSYSNDSPSTDLENYSINNEITTNISDDTESDTQTEDFDSKSQIFSNDSGSSQLDKIEDKTITISDEELSICNTKDRCLSEDDLNFIPTSANTNLDKTYMSSLNSMKINNLKVSIPNTSNLLNISMQKLPTVELNTKLLSQNNSISLHSPNSLNIQMPQSFMHLSQIGSNLQISPKLDSNYNIRPPIISTSINLSPRIINISSINLSPQGNTYPISIKPLSLSATNISSYLPINSNFQISPNFTSVSTNMSNPISSLSPQSIIRNLNFQMPVNIGQPVSISSASTTTSPLLQAPFYIQQGLSFPPLHQNTINGPFLQPVQIGFGPSGHFGLIQLGQVVTPSSLATSNTIPCSIASSVLTMPTFSLTETTAQPNPLIAQQILLPTTSNMQPLIIPGCQTFSPYPNTPFISLIQANPFAAAAFAALCSNLGASQALFAAALGQQGVQNLVPPQLQEWAALHRTEVTSVAPDSTMDPEGSQISNQNNILESPPTTEACNIVNSISNVSNIDRSSIHTEFIENVNLSVGKTQAFPGYIKPRYVNRRMNTLDFLKRRRRIKLWQKINRKNNYSLSSCIKVKCNEESNSSGSNNNDDDENDDDVSSTISKIKEDDEYVKGDSIDNVATGSLQNCRQNNFVRRRKSKLQLLANRLRISPSVIDDADSTTPTTLDMCEVETRTFNVGDLVWGPARGCPSWPGKLVSENEVKGNPKSEDGKIWVRWFGDHTFAQTDISQLKTLSEGLDNHHNVRKSHRKGRKMNPGLEAAIQEAMLELDRQANDKTPEKSRKSKRLL